MKRFLELLDIGATFQMDAAWEAQILSEAHTILDIDPNNEMAQWCVSLTADL